MKDTKNIMRVKCNIPSSKDSLKSTQAFTLVELLAVVVILAILAALLMPVGRAITEGATAATCAGHMRQVGTAIMAYRGEHNGWFPPGYPAAKEIIKEADRQPGMPEQNRTAIIHKLVPAYLGELPICPLAKLDPAFQDANRNNKAYSNSKKYLQSNGGTYGINFLLLQVRMQSMPPDFWASYEKLQYKVSKMTLLAETAWGGVTWDFTQSTQALDGIWFSPTERVTMPRKHGPGNKLNFMFLDGHIELVGRNDVGANKNWNYPDNPNGKFSSRPSGDLFVGPSFMPDKDFRKAFPEFYPPDS